MPLSSVVGAQSIVQPGVCTSTTRPASPYDGQVIYETDTDRAMVYNGTGWVVLSTGRANPGGLDLVKAETSFSGVTSVTADNVFTSAYTNYRILYRVGTSASDGSIRSQLRVGGTAATTNYNVQGFYTDNTSNTPFRLSSTTGFLFGDTKASYEGYFILELNSPAVATPTFLHHLTSTASGAYTSFIYYATVQNHTTATAYDGISFFNGSGGNISGSYTIYGYAK